MRRSPKTKPMSLADFARLRDYGQRRIAERAAAAASAGVTIGTNETQTAVDAAVSDAGGCPPKSYPPAFQALPFSTPDRA